MKSLGLMLALPIGLICGFSAPLLGKWLGPERATLLGAVRSPVVNNKRATS